MWSKAQGFTVKTRRKGKKERLVLRRQNGEVVHLLEIEGLIGYWLAGPSIPMLSFATPSSVSRVELPCGAPASFQGFFYIWFSCVRLLRMNAVLWSRARRKRWLCTLVSVLKFLSKLWSYFGFRTAHRVHAFTPVFLAIEWNRLLTHLPGEGWVDLAAVEIRCLRPSCPTPATEPGWTAARRGGTATPPGAGFHREEGWWHCQCY